jgi:multicomponent Na+:H+ antiporter subunit B
MIALAAINMRDLFAVTMLFGIYSFVAALLFLDLDAVDVAFTEAAVGAGITTVLMLSALRLTKRFEDKSHRHSLLALFVVVLTGAALVYGTTDFPGMGDAGAPVHQHVAPDYLELTPQKIGVPNVVTAVLASFRGYDTLGETVVIFSAGIAVLLLLGSGNSPRQTSPDKNTILWVVVKPVVALILLFALYVQMHGDYGAGGGFQAGVIFASAIILYSLVYGEVCARRIIAPGILPRLAALGVLIYAGTGLASLFNDFRFLDYNALSENPVSGQHLGILLVEAGVGLTVFSTVLLIFYSLSGRGVTHRE